MEPPKRKKLGNYSKKPEAIPQMPLDDAMRVLLSAPPQHKKSKKKK